MKGGGDIRRILIVDDEPRHVEGMKRLLLRIDPTLTVLEAFSGAQALDMVREGAPDMVITDIRMDDMDGLTLISQIRATQSKRIRIVVMSAYSQFDYARQAIRLGVEEYLLKPVDEDEVRRVVETPEDTADNRGTGAPADAQAICDDTILAIIGQIRRDYAEDLVLEEIAERYHYNANYLSVRFKQLAGIPFSAYVRNVRMENAIRMLRETSMRVSDVAARLYFTRRIAPCDWRITVTMSEDEPLRNVLATFQRKMMESILLMSIVICVLTLLLRRMIMNPIRKIQNALTRLGEGNFDTTISEETYSEFAHLAHVFNRMRDNIRLLIHENYEVKLAERTAEIAKLNMQMNPHFLYNTLNIIDWMIDEGSYDESRKTIRMLSDMLRYTADTRQTMADLRDDLAWLKSYLRIAEARFGRTYALEMNVPEPLMSLRSQSCSSSRLWKTR